MNPNSELKRKLILGTVQLGLDYGVNNLSGKPSESEADSILDLAYRSGVFSLDTAQAYGVSQKVIGNFLTHSPGKKFRIFTKFKSDGMSLSEQLEKTLSELAVPEVYGYSFHRFEDVQNSAIIRELENLKTKQKIKKVGVSVYTNSELEAIIQQPAIDFVQLPFNLLDHWGRRGELIKKAKANGKEIQIRSVFLQGLFYKKPSELTPYFKEISPALVKLNDLAAQNQLTMAEMALGYALSFDEIDGVLIGVEKYSQLEENLRAANAQLSKALKEEISSITVPNYEVLDPRNWK